MKRLGLLASASALIFILTAYSDGGLGVISASSWGQESMAGEDQTIELSFWTFGNTNYEELAQAYMQEHPHIRINIRHSRDQAAHHNELTARLAAGSGAPDIFQLDIGYIQRFIHAEDRFHNLNDLGAKSVRDRYPDWVWEAAASADGSFQFGLPADIGPTVAYYRADLVEQAGLPAEPASFSEAISTWDEFVHMARRFKEQTGKPFVDSWEGIFRIVRDQAEEEIYYSEDDGSFIGDRNPQVKRAYDLAALGIREGWIYGAGPGSEEWAQGASDGGFAVVPGPVWLVEAIRSHAPDTAGLWRVAQLPEGSANWGGSILVLPRGGQHPEEAYAWVEWLVSRDHQLASFLRSGMMPSIPDLYEAPEFRSHRDEFLGGQASAEEFGKAARSVKPVYYGPLHDQTDAYIMAALRNVEELGADPDAEWLSALEKIRRFVLHS